jgi:hypothetical protein
LDDMQQRLQRPKVALWTRERIDLLTTIEVRQLHANALRLGEPEIAAICDTVLSSRRGRKAVAGRPAAKRAAAPLQRKHA